MTTGLPTIPDRIQWHEGQLLTPQHFQHWQARQDAQAAWQLLAAHPLAWGVRHLEIDTGLLAAGLLRVQVLEAVFPDGSLVWHDSSDARDGTLELGLSRYAEALEAGPLEVFLTLPWSRSMRQPGAPTRFKDVNDLPVEDEVSNSEPADLPRLRPQLALTAGTVPPSLWQHLRIATVLRDNGLTRLADELPPLARIGREHGPWQRAWALCGQLRAKAAYLARQCQQGASGTEDRLALLENKVRLNALLAPLAPLEAMLRTPSLPPLSLYLALVQALGPLASLRSGAMPSQPAAWDHQRPQAMLDGVLATLEDALAEVSQEHRLLPFELRDSIFSLALRNDWLGGSRLVLGLRGQPEGELMAWMNGAVIGSASTWSSLRERRVLGAGRARIESAPELGLRGSSGYTLFQIDTSGAQVQPQELLQIANLNEHHAAQRPHELVLFVKG
jgi:type VI secretion system protein ImpJ